ncbi:MAG: hypothetical protein ACYSWY_07560 [Planctomycetota bacterium]|jgi:hypothetical protein
MKYLNPRKTTSLTTSDDEPFREIDRLEGGRTELGISGGGSFSWEQPHIYTFTLLPKIGWILDGFDTPKGSLEFELEPFVSLVKEPSDYTYEGGATIMMGYNFETGTKWVPFVHLGGGPIYSGMKKGGLSHVREREREQGSVSDSEEAQKILKTRLNAIAQMGFGAKYFFKKRTSLNAEFRWRHISNPATHDDLGMDSMFFLLGMSFYH